MTRRLMLAWVVLLAAAGTQAGRAQRMRPTEGLFSPDLGVSARNLDHQAPRRAERSRVARIDASRLRDDALLLNLFSDLVLDARRQRVEPWPGLPEAWFGHVEGEPLSAVTFVRVDGVLQGSVRTTQGAFSVEPIGAGPDYVIRQLDLRDAPQELTPLVPPLPPARQHGAGPLAGRALDDSFTLDVLVLYTAGAREQAGGSDAAVRARIVLGVAETNLAYLNSGVPHRVRLVGTELAGYVESGDLSEDLQHLTSPSDGLMDIVHARRRAVGADLVSLIVGTTAGGACGVAWVMQNLSIDFAPYAFSVAAYPCISPNYTFGHELAHNMGSAHAPEDPNAPPVFRYSFGYKDPLQQFRTVMAYDCPAGCPRVLYFSSPSASYAGRPTGTPDQHNNALSITQTGPTVANFAPTQPDAERLSGPPAIGLETHERTAMLTWSRPVVGTPTGYAIEVGSAEGYNDIALLLVNDGSATSFVQPDVAPGTYYLRVRSFDASGPSEPSASVQLVMTEAGRCLAPAGSPSLQPAAIDGRGVTLWWLAPTTGGPVDRFVIGAGTRPQSTNIGVFDTRSSDTTLTIKAAPGVYFVRVAGANGCGVGTPSNEVGIVVGPPIPGPPTNLVAAIGVDRRVTLTWAPSSVGGAAAQYLVEVGSAPGLSNVAVLPADGATPSLTVLAPPGRYYVRVRAVNQFGSSVASEEVALLVL